MRWSVVVLLWLASTMAVAQEGMLRADFRREGERATGACNEFNFTLVTGCAYELFTDHPLHIAAGSLPPPSADWPPRSGPGPSSSAPGVGGDSPGPSWARCRTTWCGTHPVPSSSPGRDLATDHCLTTMTGISEGDRPLCTQ